MMALVLGEGIPNNSHIIVLWFLFVYIFLTHFVNLQSVIHLQSPIIKTLVAKK